MGGKEDYNIFCYNCGKKVDTERNFCTFCGAKIDSQPVENIKYEEPSAIMNHSTKRVPEKVKETFLQATGKVNAMVGEQGNLNVNLKDVFSAVFRKHGNDEAEALFISGTKMTTPDEN